MKGKQEETIKTKYEQQVFALSGPVHLTSVNWNVPEHRRSVAATLVQAVYTLEHDRQAKRTTIEALAPIWWEFFHFQCIKVLIDQDDSSIFGAVFQYKLYSPYTSYQQYAPPRYIIAFRGTLIKKDTRKQDLYLNMQIALNGLTRRTRYQTALEAVEGMSVIASPSSVWLAGHSQGAAIALQAGKDMAKRDYYMESYLFNPPFFSAPIETIKDPKLKSRIRCTGSKLTAKLSNAMQGKKHISAEYDPFIVLCSWIPYLYVNPKDPICCEYIGYFEHRERMEEMGLGEIEKVATRNSIMSLLLSAFGRDVEALHLIPSAFVTRNSTLMEQDSRVAHGIDQWWNPHLYCQSKLYQLK